MQPPDRKPPSSNMRGLNPKEAKFLAQKGRLPSNKAPVPLPDPLPAQSSVPEPAGPSLARKRPFQSFFSNFRQRIAALPRPIRLMGRTVRALAPAIPICYFFSEHVMQIMWVSGPSMMPYLNEDYDQMHTKSDIILVNMWSMHRLLPWKNYRRLERGMVVTFRYGYA
jgi:inner membrane protease subunit 2